MKCPECLGRKEVVINCDECNSVGEVLCEYCAGDEACDYCNGEGFLVCSVCLGTKEQYADCETCEGTGEVQN